MKQYTRVLFFLGSLASLGFPQTQLPAPTVSNWFPQAVNQGGPGFTLRVDGTRFTQNSRVLWRFGMPGTVTLETVFLGETLLSAVVPAALIEQPGTVSLAVQQVSDGVLLTSAPFSFLVAASVSILTPCPVPNAIVGRSYEQAFAPNGGLPPYVWGLTGGTLPAGLAFTPGGLLRGVATEAVSTSFTVRVTDAQNTSASRACQIKSVAGTPNQASFITQLDPAGVLAGSQSIQLRIRGEGFTNASTVIWNFGTTTPVELTPRFDGDPRLLTVTLPLALLATPGSYPVVVRQTVLTLTAFSNVENFLVAAPVQVTSACPLRDASLNTTYSERLAASGGFPPYSWAVSQGSLPPGLTLGSAGDILGTPTEAGSYDFGFAATDSRGNLGSRVCSLRVLGPATAFPGALTFTMESAGATAPAQTISVTGTSPGLSFNLQPAPVTGGNWLRLAAETQLTPALVRVTVEPGALNPGSYQAQAIVTLDAATNRTLTIPVSLVIAAARAPALAPLPLALRFAAGRGSGRLPYQTVIVSNPGPQPLNFTVQAPAAWLTVTPDAGIVRPNSPVALQVRANADGLGAGTYRTAIQLLPPGGAAVRVPVSLSVSLATETVVVPQSGVTLTAVSGGPAPSPRPFDVLSIGANGYFWEASTTTLTGRDWLSVNPTSNASRPGVPLGSEIRANPGSLAPDIYFGDVRVSSAGTDNSPRLISTVLQVLPSGATPAAELSAAGLVFTGPAGGAAPATQVISVRNLSRSPATVDFQLPAAARMFSVVSRDPRIVAPGEARRIEVAANTVVAGQGVHRTSLMVHMSGDPQVRAVDLVLIATPAGRCTPSRLIPVLVSQAAGYQTPAGLPQAVEARIVDDCGDPLNTGIAYLTSTVAQQAVSLLPSSGGRWTGTWTGLLIAASPAALTISAEDPDRRLLGSQAVPGVVTSNPGVPVLAEDAVLSAASLARGAPLAPGSLFSGFGAGLVQLQNAATGFPLPVELGGSRMLVGERAVPLFFAGDQGSFSQINAVMPYDMSFHVPVQVAVQRALRRSAYQDVALALAGPAVFSASQTGSGQGIVVDAANPTLLADASNPVARGRVAVIYCEGLGPVNQPLLAGQAAPATPLAETSNPVTVTIDGQAATVLFAGLTPGLAGLYQVNAIVPETARPGNAVLVVVTVAGQSSEAVTIAVR